MQSPQKKNIEFEEEGDDWIDPDVYREQDHWFIYSDKYLCNS
jgi:hypothetical protein